MLVSHHIYAILSKAVLICGPCTDRSRNREQACAIKTLWSKHRSDSRVLQTIYQHNVNNPIIVHRQLNLVALIDLMESIQPMLNIIIINKCDEMPAYLYLAKLISLIMLYIHQNNLLPCSFLLIFAMYFAMINIYGQTCLFH